MIRRGSFLSRLAAFGLLAAFAAGFTLAVAQPLAQRWSDAAAAETALEDRIARLAAIAGRRGEAEARLAAVRAAVEGAGLHLPAPTEALGAADLRETIAETLDAAGAELRSLRVLPAEIDETGLRRVSVDVEMRGPFEAVFVALHALETARPYVFVRAAELSVSQGRAARRNDSAAPVVECSLLLFAYLAPGAGS